MGTPHSRGPCRASNIGMGYPINMKTLRGFKDFFWPQTSSPTQSGATMTGTTVHTPGPEHRSTDPRFCNRRSKIVQDWHGLPKFTQTPKRFKASLLPQTSIFTLNSAGIQSGVSKKQKTTSTPGPGQRSTYTHSCHNTPSKIEMVEWQAIPAMMAKTHKEFGACLPLSTLLSSLSLFNYQWYVKIGISGGFFTLFPQRISMLDNTTWFAGKSGVLSGAC